MSFSRSASASSSSSASQFSSLSLSISSASSSSSLRVSHSQSSTSPSSSSPKVSTNTAAVRSTPKRRSPSPSPSHSHSHVHPPSPSSHPLNPPVPTAGVSSSGPSSASPLASRSPSSSSITGSPPFKPRSFLPFSAATSSGPIRATPIRVKHDSSQLVLSDADSDAAKPWNRLRVISPSARPAASSDSHRSRGDSARSRHSPSIQRPHSSSALKSSSAKAKPESPVRHILNPGFLHGAAVPAFLASASSSVDPLLDDRLTHSPHSGSGYASSPSEDSTPSSPRSRAANASEPERPRFRSSLLSLSGLSLSGDPLLGLDAELTAVPLDSSIPPSPLELRAPAPLPQKMHARHQSLAAHHSKYCTYPANKEAKPQLAISGIAIKRSEANSSASRGKTGKQEIEQQESAKQSKVNDESADAAIPPNEATTASAAASSSPLASLAMGSPQKLRGIPPLNLTKVPTMSASVAAGEADLSPASINSPDRSRSKDLFSYESSAFAPLSNRSGSGSARSLSSQLTDSAPNSQRSTASLSLSLSLQTVNSLTNSISSSTLAGASAIKRSQPPPHSQPAHSLHSH